MLWGFNDEGEALWAIAFDDGCELIAPGDDRADARARAEAEHEGCTRHTSACGHLAELMRTTVQLPLQCTGECREQPAEVVSA